MEQACAACGQEFDAEELYEREDGEYCWSCVLEVDYAEQLQLDALQEEDE